MRFCEEENYHDTIPTIFLNHGDNIARKKFKKKIEQHSDELYNKYKGEFPYNTNVVIPYKNDGWYDLDQNKFIGQHINDKNSVPLSELLEAINKNTESTNRLYDVVNSLVSQLSIVGE